MEEVQELAERIALRGGAETYRIVDLSGYHSSGISVRRLANFERASGRG
jgi:hypothetical protein